MQHQHGRAIILLEGLDKTGKSTEARRLEVGLSVFGPVRVVHFGPPQGNPFGEYREAIRDADAFQGSTVIDRLHWSNEAYQAVYRANGEGLMPSHQVDQLDTLLDLAGGGVVYKTRRPEEVVAAMDGEDYGEADLDRVSDLDRRFQRRWFKTLLLMRRMVPFGYLVPDSFLHDLANHRSRMLSAASR